MSHPTWSRSVLVAIVLTMSWLVAGGAVAQARVAPDPADHPISQTVANLPTVDSAITTPIWQFALMAALACLLTLVATLTVQTILRHAHRGHGLAQV